MRELVNCSCSLRAFLLWNSWDSAMQSIVNAAQAESTAQLPALQRIRKPNGLTVAGNSLQFVGNALQVIAGAEGSIGMRTRRFPAMRKRLFLFSGALENSCAGPCRIQSFMLVLTYLNGFSQTIRIGKAILRMSGKGRNNAEKI